MDDLVILQKIYDMILWATPIVENYPRSKRFTLGTYTQNAMLELLKCVIEANKLRYRQRDPKQRTARIEAIRRADVQLALCGLRTSNCENQLRRRCGSDCDTCKTPAVGARQHRPISTPPGRATAGC